MSSDIVDVGLAVDSRQVDKGANALGKFGKQAHRTETATDKLNKSLKVGAVAAAAFATAIVVSAVKSAMEFEAALADLSAITGAAGKDLDNLAKSATELGVEMGKSGSDVLNAMKLMASAKPELLKSTAALSAMTREALILSQATGDELASSVESLANVMNQFGLDADEGSRVINVLAAASKFGAVEVGSLSESMVKVGGVSAALKVPLETTVSLLELLGKKGLKGAEAGTQLKGVLLALSTKAKDEFNPSIVGMSEALDNLAAAHLNPKEMVKLFGRENVAAALNVIELRNELEPLNKAITGTNTAAEQAAIKMDTLKGDVEKLTAAYDAQVKSLGNGLNPVLRDVTQYITELLRDTPRLKELALELAVALAAIGAQALVARAGLAGMTISLGTTTLAAKALAKALLPLAAAEGALKIFELGSEILGVYGDAQDAAAMKTIRAEQAFKIYTKTLAPLNDEALALGINLLNIDPHSMEQVGEALKKINNARREAAGDGDVAAYMQAIGDGATKAEAKIIALAQAQADLIVATPPASQDAASGTSKELTASEIAAQKQAKADALAQEQADIAAQIVIERERAKYQDLAILAETSDATKEERYLAQLDLDLIRQDEERQRFIDNHVWNEEMQATFDESQIAQAQATADRISNIDVERAKRAKEAESDSQKFIRAVRDMDVKGAINSGEKMLAVLGKQSKEAFKAHKAVATAKAVIAGYEAAVTAFAWGNGVGGPIVGAIAAAASIAFTASQISAIQSQSFGGGGGSTSAPSGGSVPAAAAPSAPSQAAPAQQVAASQPINFHMNIQTLDTASITPDTMQTMVDGFAPAIADAFGRGVHQAPLGA